MKLHLLFLFLCFSLTTHAQLSRNHYIPPLTSSDQGNANPLDQYFYISTPSEGMVSFVIIPVGAEESEYIYGQVSREVPYRHLISQEGYSQLVVDPKTTSSVMSNAGYIIEAESPIYVSVRMNAGGNAQAGALVSKGENALGTQFRIGTYDNQGSPQTNFMNFFSFMATEDNTTVNLTNNNTTGLVIQNYGTNQFPVNNILLNKGQSYVVAVKVTTDAGVIIEDNRDGLIGTLVESDKPIVVNSGSANGSFGNGMARDYGFDQIVDFSKVGTEYIFVRGDGQSSYENVLIVAHLDNTQIWVNDETTPVNATPLSAGEYYIIEGDKYTNDNMYVRTSEAVFAYQGIGGLSEANQGMFFVPPLSCENRGNIDNIALIESIGTIVYSGGITIVTKVGASVLVNDVAINALSSVQISGPVGVVGKPDYVTYKVRGLNGNIKVQSSDELYAAYFNINGSASSGSFYSGFPSNPDLNFDFVASTLGNCISLGGQSNVILRVDNFGNFDTFQWYAKDRITQQEIPVAGANSSVFTPTIIGDYFVRATINCSGQAYASKLIPISLCPADTDQDGIIDNLDLDNDNDGIKDNLESYGNATLNFSTPQTPFVIFNDYNNGLSATALINSSVSPDTENGFIGDNLGNLSSKLGASVQATNSFRLELSEASSIRITPNTNLTRPVNDEEAYVWKTLTNDKNISLWNPQDQLLVDTNFDGVYESGVNVFTSSEIRFIFNSEKGSHDDYFFVAKQIRAIQFEHQQSNPVESSQYHGKLQLIDFNRDTDLDGKLDIYDLDSDGDGCFDIVEAGFDESDTDEDGILGISPVNYDQGTIDDRGKFIGHDFNQIPLQNIAGDFFYLTEQVAPTIFPTQQPQSITVCEDYTASFGVSASFTGDPFYQWEFLSLGANEWHTLTDGEGVSGSQQATLSLLGVNSDKQGNYRVRIRTTDYFCEILSDENAVLTVLPSPLVPEVDSQSQFCFDPNYTHQISDLNYRTSSDTTSIDWYLTATDTVSIPLSTPLIDGETYYIQSRNELGCASSNRASTTVMIAPLPSLINNVLIVEQCDEDGVNDGYTLFNLTAYGERITANIASDTLIFYRDSNLSESSRIVSPTQFINEALNQTLYIKIISPYGCLATSTINLSVGASAIDENFMLYYALCDDDISTEQDGLTYFSSVILNEIYDSLLASNPVYSNQQLQIKLYGSLNNALTKNQPIDISQPYLTTTPNEQGVWANIEAVNLNTVSCIGLKKIAILYVEPKPILTPVIIDRVCDGDHPLDVDPFDGFYPFDTSTITQQLTASQTGVTTYFYGADGILIGTELPNPFLTVSQTLEVVLEKASELNQVSNSEGPCTDSSQVSFIVDAIPMINPVVFPPQCDDGEDITDGISAFDTSGLLDELLMNPNELQTVSNTLVLFTYTDLLGEVQNVNELPNPFFTRSQQVTVSFTKRINPSCTQVYTLDFRVNSLPELGNNEVVVRCLNTPPEPIGLITDFPELYTYTWAFINSEGDRILLSNDSATILPESPGTYEMTATTLDGTPCSLTKIITVSDSSSATIDASFFVLDDLNQDKTNSLQIITDNLGIGDYEFSITPENESYQDEPYFEDIPNGVFTLFIQDKNGCGISTYQSVALGYPKFFSPNGDGINDFWTVEGISLDYFPATEVYIFDRYGRLLRKFNPLYSQWDGTYNGNPMPATDYWFKGVLENGLVFKGHFSLLRGQN